MLFSTGRNVRALLRLSLLPACVFALGCGEEEDSKLLQLKNEAAAISAETGTPPPVDGLFPHTVEHPQAAAAAGKADEPVELRLTGTALRKKFGLSFYRIASYCDRSQQPKTADELVAVDCAKQLDLVMVRKISPSILERSFSEALSANDPEKKFEPECKQLLTHMLSVPMNEGQRVTLRHHPGRGMSCQVGDGEVRHVDNVDFARIVWSIYMGPKGVCEDLRTGLVTGLGEGTTKR